MKKNQQKYQEKFQRVIDRKENRKVNFRKTGLKRIWNGFAVFGTVGYSVAVPTVLFTLIGLWLDDKYPSDRSYTLALLIAGLCLGCFNAWNWIRKNIDEFSEDNKSLKKDYDK